MGGVLRVALLAVVAVQALFAVAFAFQMPFAVQMWPLPYTGAIGYIFVASIFAAAAASTLWCVLADEPAALAGVALDYVVIMTPTAVFAAQLAAGGGGTGGALAAFAAVCAVAAVLGVVLFAWSVRLPFRDARPTPRLVRYSFGVFIVALLVVGSQLVLGSQSVLPWDVTTEAAVIYGWFFIGAAAYFVYGVLRPRWPNAAGQLAGFLAYDLVLIVPFLGLLAEITEARRPSLLIYIAVVTYSGLLAIYYLFLAPATGASAARAVDSRTARDAGSADTVGVAGA
jgi:hypothetical protein